MVRHVLGYLGVKTGPTVKLRRLTAKSRNKVEMQQDEDDGVDRCHQGTPKSPSAALPGNEVCVLCPGEYSSKHIRLGEDYQARVAPCQLV